MRTSREVEGTLQFQEQYTEECDVMTAGWEILLSLIRDARWTGQSLPGLIYEGQRVNVTKYLGAGFLSQVWEGKSSGQQP